MFREPAVAVNFVHIVHTLALIGFSNLLVEYSVAVLLVSYYRRVVRIPVNHILADIDCNKKT
jgi:hypothetical protein